jgi:tetratricopeptide (TPR) repeat protein/predicted Ser/Thr protein kinase
MGVVYRAFDPELDRPVALKLLHGRGRRGTDHLLAEAQAMARLTHPNVITVYDVGLFRDQLFVAMEFLEGETLRRWQSVERNIDEILRVYVAAARGLSSAHEAGLVHRDFKPDNVMVGTDGRVVVLDFGLARLSTTVEADSASSRSTRGNSTNNSSVALGTQTEASHVGTPAYMSPEQHLGHVVDHRSDQFSFCVALYEGVYGEPPFGGSTAMERSLAVLDGAPPDPPRRVATRRVRAALLRGLSRDPAARYVSMDQLATALLPTRRIAPWAALALLSIGGALLLPQLADETKTCTGAPERVAAVWTSERATRLRSDLTEVDSGLHGEVGERLFDSLRGWGEGWSNAHREACEATVLLNEQSPQMLDRRMACLDRALLGFDEALVVLDESGEGLPTQAPRVVAGLPSLSSCSDRTGLDTSPSTDDDLEPLKTERSLSRIRALGHAGRYQDSLELAAVTAEELRQRGVQSRLPELHALWASQALNLDQGALALDILSKGLVEVERVGDEPRRLQLTVASVHAHGKTGDEASAKHAAELAGAMLDRLGTKGDERSTIERHLGVMAFRAGRPADAKQHYQRALELASDAQPLVSDGRASLHNNLGLAYRDLGEHDAAIRQFRIANETWTEFFGENHPAVAIARMNLGTVFDEEKRYDDALLEYRAARSSFERSLGPESLDVGYCHEAEAISLGEQEKYEEALASHRLAQEVFKAHAEEAAADLAMSLDNMGVVYNRMGQFERSVGLHLESLALWEGATNPTHPDLAYPLLNLGQVYLKMERQADARQVLERALELREKAQIGPTAVALLRFDLARATEPTDSKRALVLAGQALRAFKEAGSAQEVARIEAWSRRVGVSLEEDLAAN